MANITFPIPALYIKCPLNATIKKVTKTIIPQEICTINLLHIVILKGAYNRGEKSVNSLELCDLFQWAVVLQQQWMMAEVAVQTSS